MTNVMDVLTGSSGPPAAGRDHRGGSGGFAEVMTRHLADTDTGAGAAGRGQPDAVRPDAGPPSGDGDDLARLLRQVLTQLRGEPGGICGADPGARPDAEPGAADVAGAVADVLAELDTVDRHHDGALAIALAEAVARAVAVADGAASQAPTDAADPGDDPTIDGEGTPAGPATASRGARGDAVPLPNVAVSTDGGSHGARSHVQASADGVDVAPSAPRAGAAAAAAPTIGDVASTVDTDAQAARIGPGRGGTDVTGPPRSRAQDAEALGEVARHLGGEPRAGAPGTTGAEAPEGGSRPGPAGARGVLPQAVERVLQAVAELEHAPPPRQLTLDLGEARIRVALEDGQVRLTVVGDGRSADELVDDAAEALREHGFDLAGGDEDGPGDGLSEDDDREGSAGNDPASGRRPGGRHHSDTGLRL